MTSARPHCYAHRQNIVLQLAVQRSKQSKPDAEPDLLNIAIVCGES